MKLRLILATALAALAAALGSARPAHAVACAPFSFVNGQVLPAVSLNNALASAVQLGSQCAGNGNAAAPGISFASTPSTGLFRRSDGGIGAAIAGVEVATIGADGFTAGTLLAPSGQAAITFGPNGDISYPANATKIENGGLYIFRPNPSGFNGTGTALSVVTGAFDGGIVPGGAPWGSNGNTAQALGILAQGNGAAAIGTYVGSFSATPAYTVSSGILCGTSPSYPANPCTRISRNSGTFDVTKLYINEALITNTTPRLTSLIAAFDPAGAWIDVPGWTQNNYPSGNPDPNLTNYNAGNAGTFVPAGGSLGVSIGVYTGQFAQNTQLVASSTVMPAGGFYVGWELDVSNLTGSYNFGTDFPHMDGIDIIGTGNAQFSHGIRVGGIAGLTNAPVTAIQVDNFASAGIQVNQAGFAGGVGLSFIMQNGIPINVNNGSGNSWQIDFDGNQTMSGDLTQTGEAKIGAANIGPTCATRFYAIAGLSVGQNCTDGGSEVDLISPAGFRFYTVDTGTAQLVSTTPYLTVDKFGNMGMTGNVSAVSISYSGAIADGSATTASVSSGGTYTFAAAQSSILLQAGGTLASFTVALPSSPGNGQIASFTSQQQITSLTVNAPGGASVVAPPTSLSDTWQTVTFKYVTSLTSWIHQTGT